jgi:hypothetical protein
VYIHDRLSEQFSVSQVAYGTTFRVPGGYQKDGITSSLKRVNMEGFSQLVSDFIEVSRNFIFEFLHKKTAKNCENNQRSFTKYYFDF